jgi:hypothetical protein
MRKGTTMSATQRRLLMGHQPACHASLMSFVLDVPTVVRYIKRKKICMKESKGSSFLRRETNTHICNIGFFIYVQNTRSIYTLLTVNDLNLLQSCSIPGGHGSQK